MKRPPNLKRRFSSSDKTIITLVIGFLVIILIGILFLFAVLLGQMPGLPPLTFLQPSVAPTLFVPTADCGSPILVLGTTTFQIQTMTPAPDGSLQAPPDIAGVAYWLEGTDNNYVFILSQTPDNLSLLSTLPSGSTATATWKNCNSTSYSLFAPEQGFLAFSTLPDQSLDGITIFVQSDPSGSGFRVKGELTEEQITTIDTPASGGSEIQAEISLLETTTSADGATIRISVSIQNYGASAFTLSASDVSLTQDANPLVMVSSEPALPKEIRPGSTETFQFTFPRPTSQTATLKILGVEYDIEGY